MTRILFFLLLTFAASAQSVDFTIEDRTFVAGDTVNADFLVYGFDTIRAYQFTTLFDPAALQFVSVETSGSSLGLTQDDFGLWNLDDGQIRHVVMWASPTDLPPGSYMFTYRFVALVDGSLSQFMALEPELPYWSLYPVAYSISLLPWPLTLSFVAPSTSVASPVSATNVQAIPNPCPMYTTIAFDATGETEFICHVTDMSGRHIKTITGTTSPGTNEFPITLPASGMYLVAIKTKCATFVEKVVAH